MCEHTSTSSSASQRTNSQYVHDAASVVVTDLATYVLGDSEPQFKSSDSTQRKIDAGSAGSIVYD